MARDYYQMLGVKRDASKKEIRQAYRRLARKNHPDVNPGDKMAGERFKEINNAYEVLSDPEKRVNYDRHGQGWEYAARMEEAARKAGFSGNRSDLGGIFDGRGGFESILEGLFGGIRRQDGPTPGQNVEYEVKVTLEEAYAGTSRWLDTQGERACSSCRTSGRIAGATCHKCQGVGRLIRPHQLEVKIPPGVSTGSRVRIQGEGRLGQAGGPRGDLYLVVTVQEHHRFDRQGDDIHTDLNLPCEDAVVGTEAIVRTVTGKQIILKIPPLTQNGRVFRLSGLGMPRLDRNGTGDLLVRVQVVLPEHLNDEQQRLFQRLQELRAVAGASEGRTKE